MSRCVKRKPRILPDVTLEEELGRCLVHFNDLTESATQYMIEPCGKRSTGIFEFESHKFPYRRDFAGYTLMYPPRWRVIFYNAFSLNALQAYLRDHHYLLLAFGSDCFLVKKFA
jgi:hypothetical protein